MKWPMATHTTEDGELLRFPYCCWTFCAWPELLALLAARTKRRLIAVKCRECPRLIACLLILSLTSCGGCLYGRPFVVHDTHETRCLDP